MIGNLQQGRRPETCAEQCRSIAEGWEEKKLGEVIQLEYGKPLADNRRKASGKYPVYGANGEKDRTDDYYHDKPSIIVGRKGSAGEINLTESKFWPLDVTYFVTYDKTKYDLKYLYNTLFSLELQKLAKGVKPGINRNEVYAIDLTIPPLPEQKRIVAILDKAFSGISRAKEIAEKNLANAKAIFKSNLESIFLQLGEEWIDTTLGKILDKQPRNGWSPPAASHSDSGTPVLTLSSVTGFQFKPEKVKFTSAATDTTRHYWVTNGDFLLTRSNTPKLVGHVAIANGIENPTIYPDLIMRMNPNTTKALTRFIYYQLRTAKLRNIIMGRAQGANPTMKKISKEAVQTLPIRITSISKQEQIVSKLDALSAETKKLESIYRQKLASLEELKKSILQKAFSGALTGAAS